MSLLLSLAMLLTVAPVAFADEVTDLKKRVEKLEAEVAALKQLLKGGNGKAAPSIGGTGKMLVGDVAYSDSKATRDRTGKVTFTFLATNEEKKTKECIWTAIEVVDNSGNRTEITKKGSSTLRIRYSLRAGVATKVVVEVEGVSKDANSATLTLVGGTSSSITTPTITLKDIAID
jgi:hypothetical protein